MSSDIHASNAVPPTIPVDATVAQSLGQTLTRREKPEVHPHPRCPGGARPVHGGPVPARLP
ncbi:hypothetical protein [Demequina litorisediminis]|uniref:hypothetical protein n=1 Tax=Demequina litorisediminis TaxID=1849022 RepID=UPI0032AF0E04